MARLPFLIQFPLALLIVLVVGFVLLIVTALQIYILAWLLGLIGSLF